MLHIISNADRSSNTSLFGQMFRSRTKVFRDKLKWDVKVTDGLEFDRYDTDGDPLYLVLTDQTGNVSGSLRLLPTTGDTMMGREFAYMFDEPVDVRSPSIWECTRFCVPHDEGNKHVDTSRASSDLLIGLCDFCLHNGIDQVLGLYEKPMTRIYRKIGWSPAVLARSRPEVGSILAGVWDVTETALENMRMVARHRRVGVAA